jgi:hypothetical protein
VSRKGLFRVLIVAARQLGVCGDCRADGWPTGPAFAVEGGAAAIAFDVHLEDGGVVDEAIDDGERHRLVGEDLAPFAERLVGGDEQGSPLVPGTDEFEEHAGFRLILGDVGEVVEDQQVVFVELGDGRFESELASGDLQSLDETGGTGEQDAPAVFDESEAERCRQVALSAARRAEHDQVGAFFEPAITGGERHDLGLADDRYGFEVEGVEGLAGRQSGFGKMAFDAAPGTLGHLVLGEGGQEAGRRPSFLVGLGGKIGPDQFDRRQPQFGQEQLDAGGVDGIGGLHAAPPARTVPSSP